MRSNWRVSCLMVGPLELELGLEVLFRFAMAAVFQSEGVGEAGVFLVPRPSARVNLPGARREPPNLVFNTLEQWFEPQYNLVPK